MDAEVTAAKKWRYRRRQIERAFDSDDEFVRNIYKVDVFTAMRWFKEIWEEVPTSIIASCWKHTNLLATSRNGSSLNIAVGDRDSEQSSELQRRVYELMPRVSDRNRISVADLLNPVGGDEVFQIVFDETLM